MERISILTQWVLRGHMLCVSTMIIKTLNALLSSQMFHPFHAKQGGCDSAGHLESRTICLIVCVPRLLSKTHFLLAEDKTPTTQQSTDPHCEGSFTSLQKHQWECFHCPSSPSHTNSIQLHKHLEELLWFSRLFQFFHSNKCTFCLFLHFCYSTFLFLFPKLSEVIMPIRLSLVWVLSSPGNRNSIYSRKQPCLHCQNNKAYLWTHSS